MSKQAELTAPTTNAVLIGGPKHLEVMEVNLTPMGPSKQLYVLGNPEVSFEMDLPFDGSMPESIKQTAPLKVHIYNLMWITENPDDFKPRRHIAYNHECPISADWCTYQPGQGLVPSYATILAAVSKLAAKDILQEANKQS